MTEYLYDKNDPQSRLRSPITGIQGFFRGVPNLYERAQLVARAVAKQNDGDLTRFVMQTKKPRDEAQRWRALKNIVRFHKNPLAYIYWKTIPFFNQNRVHLIYFLLAYHMWSTFYICIANRKTKIESVEKYAYSTGRFSDLYRGVSAEYRMPQDLKKCFVRYSNFHQMRRNKRPDRLHLPWWCRDQNFRKYFEMRKKNGIRPALNNFAHEKHYKQYIKIATRKEEIREEYIRHGDPYKLNFKVQ